MTTTELCEALEAAAAAGDIQAQAMLRTLAGALWPADPQPTLPPLPPGNA